MTRISLLPIVEPCVRVRVWWRGPDFRPTLLHLLV